jgi:hypothetical protein
LFFFGLGGLVTGVSTVFSAVVVDADFSTYTLGTLNGQNSWAQIGTTSTVNPIQVFAAAGGVPQSIRLTGVLSADHSVQSTSATTYGLNYLRLGAYQAGSDADVDNLLIKDTDRNVVVYANDFSSANLDDFRTWFEADTPSLSRNLQEGNADYVRVVNGRLRMESIGYNGGDGRDTYESWAGATLKQKLPENFELSFTFNRLGGWSGAFGIDIFTDPLFTESALNAGFAGHWFGGFTSFFPTPINGLSSPIYNYDFFTSDTIVKIVKSGAEARMYINDSLVATTQLGLVLDTD